MSTGSRAARPDRAARNDRGRRADRSRGGSRAARPENGVSSPAALPSPPPAPALPNPPRPSLPAPSSFAAPPSSAQPSAPAVPPYTQGDPLDTSVPWTETYRTDPPAARTERAVPSVPSVPSVGPSDRWPAFEPTTPTLPDVARRSDQQATASPAVAAPDSRPERTSTGGGRRRAATTTGTQDSTSYIPPVREPRFTVKALRAMGMSSLTLAWLAGFLVALTALVAVPVPGDHDYAQYGAAVLAVVFTAGVVRRSGGRTALWTTLVAVLVAVALVTGAEWARAAVAVVTAVFGAVLAVLVTRPATSVRSVVREYVIALVVASSAAVAVAAWNATLVYQRFYLVVMLAALAMVFGIVWSLGAGLHGLGRRGVALIVAAATALAVLLAYATVLRTYGSPEVVSAMDGAVTWMRETIRGVPRPAEVLIGFPALVWGISTRSHRRQGWWMCAFGVVGTAVMATALGSPNADTAYVAISTFYSAVLGLALGLVVRALDPGSTSRTGRRAAQSGDVASRPEPARFSPLK